MYESSFTNKYMHTVCIMKVLKDTKNYTAH